MKVKKYFFLMLVLFFCCMMTGCFTLSKELIRYKLHEYNEIQSEKQRQNNSVRTNKSTFADAVRIFGTPKDVMIFNEEGRLIKVAEYDIDNQLNILAFVPNPAGREFDAEDNSMWLLKGLITMENADEYYAFKQKNAASIPKMFSGMLGKPPTAESYPPVTPVTFSSDRYFKSSFR